MSNNPNRWPAGHDPSRDTTNGAYGAKVPGGNHWSRSFLQYNPATIKNRQLEKFRSKLSTSSEEYGNYWAKAHTPQGTPFYHTKAQPSHHYANFQRVPDMLKYDMKSGDADENLVVSHGEPTMESLRNELQNDVDKLGGNPAWQTPALPPIVNTEIYRDKRNGDVMDIEGQRLHLPDIRQIDITFTMADSSVVTMKTVPNKPYQFFR